MSDNRSHIDEECQWDLNTVFVTDDAWEAELTSLDSGLGNTRAYKGHLTASSNNLLAITENYLALSCRLEKLYVYASMKNDQDTTVAKYQEYQAKATATYAKFSEIFAFHEPELMQLSKEAFEDFVAEILVLSAYACFFEQLFKRQPHVLSQTEEELLAGAQEIFGAAEEIFGLLDNTDIIFPIVLDDEGEEIQLTHGSFISLLESKNRDVHKEAYQALYATYEQFQHTYAGTLQISVKVHNYEARVHHFKSAREAALSANFTPESVYDTLIEAVNANLPLLHRYVELRKKILKLDDLKMYDIHTPLSEVDMSFTHEEALAKAEDVLAVFGREYSERVHRAFTERWIDVHVNKGKHSGAYSGGSYDTNALVLLNWQDILDDLFTLVHETGHGLHSTFTHENQPYVYGDYSIFLAGIASITDENILTETLLKGVDDDKARFAILNHYLNGFKSTIFRQVQLAEFRDIIHKADQAGEVLTSGYLNQLYADLNEKYYRLSKADNPGIQYEWARIPYFYYNYYVYQYATGLAVASYLADKVVHGTQADINRYLDYLKAGNSDYPLNVIKKAGVDMTTSAYLDAVFRILEERLDELEVLIEKGVHL